VETNVWDALVSRVNKQKDRQNQNLMWPSHSRDVHRHCVWHNPFRLH